jgi:hypothetical protein
VKPDNRVAILPDRACLLVKPENDVAFLPDYPQVLFVGLVLHD